MNYQEMRLAAKIAVGSLGFFTLIYTALFIGFVL